MRWTVKPDFFDDRTVNDVNVRVIRDQLRLSIDERLMRCEEQARQARYLRTYRRRVRAKIASAAPHLLPIFDTFKTLRPNLP